MFFTFLLLILGAALFSVNADQIFIYSPPKNAVYNAKDIMDLRYKVRFIGMTKIWSTSTSLVHLETNTFASNFTDLKWVYSTNNTVNSVHDIWNIPSNVKNGTYSFIVTANVTQPCSENNDGKAPFLNCNTIQKHNVTFSIQNNA